MVFQGETIPLVLVADKEVQGRSWSSTKQGKVTVTSVAATSVTGMANTSSWMSTRLVDRLVVLMGLGILCMHRSDEHQILVGRSAFLELVAMVVDAMRHGSGTRWSRKTLRSSGVGRFAFFRSWGRGVAMPPDKKECGRDAHRAVLARPDFEGAATSLSGRLYTAWSWHERAKKVPGKWSNGARNMGHGPWWQRRNGKIWKWLTAMKCME